LRPQYPVCNYIPDDFYPATVTDVMAEEIHALNRESLMPAPSMTRRNIEELISWPPIGRLAI